MKRSAILLVAAIALLSSATAMAQEYLISVAIVAPEGSLWMKEMHRLDAKVREKTNGHVGFKFYPGGVAGDDKTVIQKIRGGQFVGAGVTGVGMGEIVPESRVIESPFTFRSYAEVDYVLKKLSTWFKAEFEKKGFKVLGWADQGFVYMMSKKKLASVDDVKKAKPWVWDVDPLGQAAFKAFGINPIPLSLENVTTSLDSGMIDTIYISPAAAVALQWYRKVTYVIDVPITDGAGAIIISKAFFDKMPEEYQVTLETLSAEYLRNLAGKTREENDRALKQLLGKGLTSVAPSAAERDKFMKVGEAAANSLVGKLYPQKLLDKVRALLTEYRAGKGK